jgi:hypothetical protein
MSKDTLKTADSFDDELVKILKDYAQFIEEDPRDTQYRKGVWWDTPTAIQAIKLAVDRFVIGEEQLPPSDPKWHNKSHKPPARKMPKGFSSWSDVDKEAYYESMPILPVYTSVKIGKSYNDGWNDRGTQQRQALFNGEGKKK